jgi:hypothetical protein
MGFLSNLFSSNAARCRAEASRLGMHVAEVKRDCPVFARDMESMELKRRTVARYSLLRRASPACPGWELLQRTTSMGASLPNAYLVTSSAPLPERLMQELSEVAQAFSEEFFEFEGTSSDVAVFWEEWGGPGKVQSLHQVLKRLAA